MGATTLRRAYGPRGFYFYRILNVALYLRKASVSLTGRRITNSSAVATHRMELHGWGCDKELAPPQPASASSDRQCPIKVRNAADANVIYL
jgi:hypothetical protein